MHRVGWLCWGVIITTEIFHILDHTEPGKGGEIQLTDALKVLARQQDMYAYDFVGRRYDVGDKQGYLEAQVEFALRREDLAGMFRGVSKNYCIVEKKLPTFRRGAGYMVA